MNKKYIILRTDKPLRAQWGDKLTTGWKDAGPQGQAGIISGVSNAVNAGSNMLFDNAMEKNSKKDAFGNEVFDDKDAKIVKQRSTVDGVLKGASQGASIGAFIPVPGGALIGAGIGALAGGINGLIKGKKSAEEQEDAAEAGLQRSTMAAARDQDIRALKALTGKSGRKLGNFKLVKKKVQQH